jgi:hypothetical protein
MTTIELTRFRVEPDRVDDLLRARPAMPADFRAGRTGIRDFFAATASLGSAEEGTDPDLS